MEQAHGCSPLLLLCLTPSPASRASGSRRPACSFGSGGSMLAGAQWQRFPCHHWPRSSSPQLEAALPCRRSPALLVATACPCSSSPRFSDASLQSLAVVPSQGPRPWCHTLGSGPQAVAPRSRPVPVVARALPTGELAMQPCLSAGGQGKLGARALPMGELAMQPCLSAGGQGKLGSLALLVASVCPRSSSPCRPRPPAPLLPVGPWPWCQTLGPMPMVASALHSSGSTAMASDPCGLCPFGQCHSPTP